MREYVIEKCPYCGSKEVDIVTTLNSKLSNIEEDYYCKKCMKFFYEDDLLHLDIKCLNCWSDNVCIEEEEEAIIEECTNCGEFYRIPIN